MKYLSLILLTICCKFCLGQGARFQFYLTKACTATEKLDTSYYLMPVGRFDTAFYPKNGTVYLPSTGRYVIGFNSGPDIDSPYIDIKDTGSYIFRYKEPRIQLYNVGAFDTPLLYVKCDTLINGYQEDFYPNGNVKLRGNFSNGYRKDSLVKFYDNGKVQKRIMVLPKVINIEEYDSAGNLIKLSNNQNKSFMSYWEYRWTEFFPGGKIKASESSIKRVKRMKEFYPSGQIKLEQTKNHRIEFYPNGLKDITYRWRYKDEDFTIYKNEYDTNGLLLQSTVYELWGDGVWPQPDLDISKSDWIVSLKKYDHGKEIANISDIDTKAYLKEHSDD